MVATLLNGVVELIFLQILLKRIGKSNKLTE